MWCTRWFLPLVILPLPTAPPYFLAIFLISMLLHARPCFYCMMLLTALFTSSCYWQGVPPDATLTRPLGNATTFGEAILANISLPPQISAQNYSDSLQTPLSVDYDVHNHLEEDVTLDSRHGPQTPNGGFDKEGLLPPIVQLLDRCWCNVFSRNGLFEPTDVSRWEQESIRLARKDVEEKVKAEFAPPSGPEGDRENDERAGVGMGDGFTKSKETGDKKDVMDDGLRGDADVNREHQSTTAESPFSFRNLRNLLFPTASASNTAKFRLRQPSSTSPSSSQSPSVPSQSPIASASESQPESNEDSSSDSSASDVSSPDSNEEQSRDAPEQPLSSSPMTKPTRMKILRPFYDLRPYGIDITLDFRWRR